MSTTPLGPEIILLIFKFSACTLLQLAVSNTPPYLLGYNGTEPYLVEMRFLLSPKGPNINQDPRNSSPAPPSPLQHENRVQAKSDPFLSIGSHR